MKDVRGRTGQASLTPDFMDMCTPYEVGNKKNIIPPPRSTLSEMIFYLN